MGYRAFFAPRHFQLNMLQPTLSKNDRLAHILIISFSLIIFLCISMLVKTQVDVNLGFDVHIFATINAMINATVSVLLVLAVQFVKNKNYEGHKKTMLAAILLSVVFLVCYVAHHLFAGETKFGGEGPIRYFYYFILITHILLAGIIMPFVLYTAYRALIGEYVTHKKLARITYPIWLYVTITGVMVYVLISPYYQ